ncbi:hypothetical protein HELRODRAFT_191983 [Helobdella robusta]|uniref:TAFH domain-containing protein n=1 Tax=Helobdella robusta TaxID=6412 RepID=T1FTH5_HELRO|nr:hypothetical protein HELRODRAFT_191983 [Helobdella robusta]ESO03273.1 hypothetical protein HELRODRAFT_191983 [Helobdella robusta]
MMNSGVPPGLVVTKNEQGQLVVVQQFQLQQPQSRPAQVVRPIIQASIIATATTTSSASAAAGTRSLFIQPQHILPHTQQQQQLTATTTLTQRVPLLPVQPTTTTMIVAQQQQQQPQLQLAPNVIVNQQQQLSLTNQIQPNGDALTSINKEVVENVRKCKNFLSTLLKLAANQPKETLDNVLSLIQGLVDNAVTPEEFTTQLQKELKSSPQPYLIPFLKKSLPYLRQFLSNNKMQIDGIRPPISNTSTDDTNSNNTNNIIIQNNTNSIVNTTNNNNNSVVFLTATQQQQQLHQQQQTIVAATTTQASMLAVDGSNSRTTIRPVTGIPQQQQKLQNIQQQQQIRLMQALPISNNNNTNNTNNNISATPETTRLLQTRFSNPSSNTHQLLNNLTTGQQKLQAQQLAALHTNTNFIAPTTPLPSSLPRLILSSNSTLLASFPQVQPVSTTPTTTVAAIIATTTAAAVAAATTTTTLAAPKVINNINNNMTATLLRNNNNILPTSLAAQQQLQQQLHHHRQQQIQQHLQASRPEKRKFETISRTEDDDINDVATMGGVNLNEETRNILSVTSILSTGQLRSCTEESFLDQHLLSKFVSTIAQRKGLSTVQPDSINMLSMAVKEKLKTILEQLSVLSEHRTEIYKNEKLLTLKSEVKRQMKFRQEIARLEGERVREIESQAIMKAAKSRTKTDDPDQLKKKELAKKQQMQEMEDKRKEQSNITALAAIGPRKQRSFTILPDSLLASSASSSSNHHILTNNSVGSTGGLLNVSGVLNNGNVLGGSFSLPGQTLPLRNRVKRATSKDLLYIMQQDKRLSRSALLYKAFIKF